LPISPPTLELVGDSPAFRRAVVDLDRVAPLSVPVVLRGPSGAGKELFARRLHEKSGRTGALIPVNCAALPADLAEAMLFGHRRGAYTGATEAGVGLVAAADHGTLFLDEVAELTLPLQAKLLRVLQEGAVLPVGEHHERKVSVRVVCASHRDLRAAVAAGRFREDLYYRLARVEVVLPRLADRGRDVVTIARRLLDGAELREVGVFALARQAEPVLLAYDWPGNVRELQSALLRAALRARRGVITAADLEAVLGLAVVDREPEPRAPRVLDLLRRSGALSIGDLRAVIEMPSTSMKRLLLGLVASGDVEVVGEGRTTRYRLPEVAAPVDDRAAIALDIVRREGRVTRQALVEAARVPDRTASRVLGELVAAGALLPDGRKGRAGGYVAAQV
jgi:DNA-binding NtrC family response regulator